MPPNPALTWIGFSPDGKRFAFTQQRDNGIELWVGDTATGQAKAVTPAQLNASLGTPCELVGDGASLLCRFVSPSRGAAPADAAGAAGPEHSGEPRHDGAGPHLSGPADERARRGAVRLLRHQPARVRRRGQRPAHAGRLARGLRDRRRRRPTATTCSSSRVRRPYSWLVPYTNFPSTVEVWDRKGAVVKTDRGPADGRHGAERRRAARAAQLSVAAARAGDASSWAEALDNGDPKNKVPHRDKVMTLAAPFTAAPAEIAQDRVPLRRRCRGPTAAPRCCHRERSRAGAGRARGSSTSRARRRASCGIAARKTPTAIPARRCAASGASGTSTIRAERRQHLSSPAPARRPRARGRSSIAST